MKLTRLNPDSMHKNPAFTQVITVTTPATMIYVGGQNGVAADGKVVGDTIAAQSAQAYQNVLTALDAAGATINDVVSMTLYIVQGQSLQEGFAAIQPLMGKDTKPSTISMMFVAGLANPAYLIEISAVAALG